MPVQDAEAARAARPLLVDHRQTLGTFVFHPARVISG